MKNWMRLGAVLAAGALLVSAGGTQAEAGTTKGRFDRPQSDYAKVRKLAKGTPKQVGLDGAALDKAWADVESWTQTKPGEEHPRYPGAVLTYGHAGKVVMKNATGFSRKYANATDELPRDQWIETRTDTIYDMASVSKLFTSIVVMQQVEKGLIDLDAPAATYIPEFAQNGKEAVTVRMLLTHTSGFTPFIPIWKVEPDRAARIQAVWAQGLDNEPGTTYTYSDLNLITLGEISAKVTGKPLDQLVTEGITEPLGMVDTGYNPPESKLDRVAATEFQAVPDRGMVWGQVHDENAWSLDGVAGHAGIFSTADDMAILAQTFLNGGTYDRKRILEEETVTAMITNENTEFPGDAHGLGFELDQMWYMGGLASGRTAGHTGYTGTSIVIDFQSNSFAVLLSNRVHPSRSWGSVNPAREAAATGLADAMSVKPVKGNDYWRSDRGSKVTNTIDLTVPATAAKVDLQAFVETESSDPLSLEVSTDGGKTFTFLPFTVDGVAQTKPYGAHGLRAWQDVSAALPAATDGQPVVLRVKQTFDTLYSGRGLLVDDVQVTNAAGKVVLNGESKSAPFVAQGWSKATR
ncbi:serine hydrolase [Propionibacteriaceae bacterium Y1685]